jgi:Ca-activated chloride channel family protein
MSNRRARRMSQWQLVGWFIAVLVSVNAVAVAVVVAHHKPAASSPSNTPTPTTPVSSAISAAASMGHPVMAFAADRPAARSGAAPCVRVQVLASLENADTVRSLATSYMSRPRDVGGRCVRVDVRAEESGDAEVAAATGFRDEPTAARPTIWLPDSSAWLRIAHRTGGSWIPAAGTSVAEAAVVVAMPAPLATAIGWRARPPSWADVFAAAADPKVWTRLGHPGWGAFKLGKTSPLTSTSGLLALVASFAASDDAWSGLTPAQVQSRSALAKVAKSELATSHYMSTPQQFLYHAREAVQEGSLATFLSAMVVDEKTLWDYNRGIGGSGAMAGTAGMAGMAGMDSTGGTDSTGGMAGMNDPPKMQGAPREKLVAVYPREGVFAADNPAAIMNGNWVSNDQRAAAADFVRYARTSEGQTVVRNSGFRDVTWHASLAEADNGFTARTPHSLATPDAGVLSAVQRNFPAVRKHARVLFLVDVSGSMKDRISRDATKLSAAKLAIANAIRYLGNDDEVGLAAFSNRPHGGLTPGLITAIAPLRTNRSALLAGVRALRPVSQTPLYHAVDSYTAAMLRSYQPDRINAVVVLSDGRNDTEQTETRPQLLSRLAQVHMRAPILVFTCAYGHNADINTLNMIAESTGAHFYDATDPSTVNKVLAHELVTSF